MSVLRRVFVILFCLDVYLASLRIVDASDSLLDKGVRAYQDFEYADAITYFTKFLSLNDLSIAKKTQTFGFLAISLYNLERFDEAQAVWKKAHRTLSNFSLPPGQAPNVLSFFKKIKVQLKQESTKKKVEHSSSKSSKQEALANKINKRLKQEASEKNQGRSFSKKRISFVKKTGRPDLQSKSQGIKRKERLQKSLLSPGRPPKRRSFWNRHMSSTMMLSAGIAVAASAGVIGGFSYRDYQDIAKEKGSTNVDHLSSRSTILNALWATSGVTAVGAITLFLFESTK